MKSPIQFFIAVAILLATATVAAQVYKWVDKDGQVQFTDTPPPPGASKAEAKKIDAGTSVPAASTTPVKTLSDRAKDFDKRQKAAAENAKKADELRKREEIAEANCKAVRTTLRELESGRAMRRINDTGELVVMSDEVREAELAKMRATVAESCKA